VPRLACISTAALLIAACSGGPAATSSTGPPATPPPTTAATATVAPPPTPTAVPTNAAGVRTCPSSSEGAEKPCLLEAGTYATAFQTPGLTYTVPDPGWSSLDREVSPGNFHLFPPGASMAGFNAGSSDVITVIASGVAPGTCTGAPSTMYPATFDGLLAFLKADPDITISGLKDESVGGLDGKVLDIAYAKSDGCVDGAYADLYVGVGRSHGQFAIPPQTSSIRLYLLHVPGNDKALVIEVDDAKGGGSDYDDTWATVSQQVVDSFIFAP
jgi:hypothetical protein